MLGWILKKVFGTQNQRTLNNLKPLVEKVNEIEQSYQSLSDEQLKAKTAEFRERLKKGETLDDILPEAFAAVKNTCRRFSDQKRIINVRGHELLWAMTPFDTQLLGGMVLHSGKITEMATGEGKTLVATLPVYLNALESRGVHVITVNDYLAARDAEWVGEVYRFLGMTVGCIQHGQSPAIRREQYACDVTYGTCSEFGFDYLRDNGLATRPEELVQRDHAFAIIDEADSILIDEARTPLIISGPASVSTHQYDKFKSSIDTLVRKQTTLCNDLMSQAKKFVDENKNEEAGKILLKVKMGMPRHKQLTKYMENPDLRRAIDDAELAIYQDTRRKELYKIKEELYYSIDEKSQEADLSEMGRQFLNPNDPETFTMPDVVSINMDIDQDASLSADQKLKAKQEAQLSFDDANQRIHNISQLLKAYSLYEQDVHYVIQENKVVIVDEYTGRLMPGRRWSDGLHQAIEAKEGVKIDRETQTFATITIQNYFRLYDKLAGMTGTAETEIHELRDIYRLDVVVIPTHRICVREDGDDIIFKTRREKINAVVNEIKKRHAKGQPILVGTTSVESSEVFSRVLKQQNVPHTVLNAKFNQQEAEIVSRAGQPGAVTIATNMAGRGTDIKLGEGVSEVGGLHVIGTERHESRRIDRQLRGRCARQGDPGSSQFYISFEDDLMRNFGDSRRIAALMTRFGMKDEEGIQHPLLNHTVETAQKRVEQRNYQIRKHTLQYDDVMNQQRSVVYTFRSEIVRGENTREELNGIIDEVIGEEAQTYLGNPDSLDREAFIRWVNNSMPIGLQAKDIESLSQKQAEQLVKSKIKEAYELKIKGADPVNVVSLERSILLNSIDQHWQEHLYAMDGLRTSINLRAYGQKDPLTEYKTEAFYMFEGLMAQIKREVLTNLFRSAAGLLAFEQMMRSMPQKFIHEAPESMGGHSDEQGVVEEKKQEFHLPVHRDAPKVGRNDPCPNHPDKKYKNCCGKNVD